MGLKRSLRKLNRKINALRRSLDCVHADVARIETGVALLVAALPARAVVGIMPTHGPPEHRPGETPMATCNRIKKSALKSLKAAPSSAKTASVGTLLVDNEDDTVTVMGADAGGNPVDISALAALTASSSDATVLSVDPPAGMTYKEHALKPGHADVTLVATASSPAPSSSCSLLASPSGEHGGYSPHSSTATPSSPP